MYEIIRSITDNINNNEKKKEKNKPSNILSEMQRRFIQDMSQVTQYFNPNTF